VIVNAGLVNITYVAFVPQLEINLTLSDAALLGLKTTLNGTLSYSSNTIDQVSHDHVRLYATTSRPVAAESGGFTSASEYETIECGFYNASYVVNFTFSNGQQDVIVTNMTQLNGVSLSNPSTSTETTKLYKRVLAPRLGWHILPFWMPSAIS